MTVVLLQAMPIQCHQILAQWSILVSYIILAISENYTFLTFPAQGFFMIYCQ